MGMISTATNFEVVSFTADKTQVVPEESIAITVKLKNVSGAAIKVWSAGIGVDAKEFTQGVGIQWLTYVVGSETEQSAISWAKGATKSFTWTSKVPKAALNPFQYYEARAVPLVLEMVSGTVNDLSKDVYVSEEVTVLNTRFSPQIDTFELRRGIDGVEDDEGTGALATIKLSETSHDEWPYVFEPSCKILYAPKNDPENVTSVDLTERIAELLTGVENATDVVTMEISTGSGYDFEIIFGDEWENAVAYIDIDRAFANFALSEYGEGAAFGAFPSSTPGSPLLESEYLTKLYKGAEIEDVRFGWHTGDSIDFDSMAVFNGYLTSSTKAVFFSISMGMPIYAKSATVSGAVVIRGIGGYLNNMSSGTGQDISASGYTPSVQIVNAATGLLRVVVSKSSAWTNATNNTPISVQVGSAGLKITFSDEVVE